MYFSIPVDHIYDFHESFMEIIIIHVLKYIKTCNYNIIICSINIFGNRIINYNINMFIKFKM